MIGEVNGSHFRCRERQRRVPQNDYILSEGKVVAIAATGYPTNPGLM